MVFQGQDAWRKLPHISGQWKRPLPHLGLAIGIFSAYLVGESLYEKIMVAPSMKSAHKDLPKYEFVTDQFGDVSEVRKLKYKYSWDDANGLSKVRRSDWEQVWKREEE